MSVTWQLFTGLDFAAPLDIYAQGTGELEDVSSATIVASLLSADGATELIADTAQSSASSGATWASGRVVVQFPLASTNTAAIIAAVGTTLRIGIKITSGGLTQSLSLIPVEIVKGY